MVIVKVLYGITNNQTDRNVINHLLLVYKTLIFQCRKNVNLFKMKNYKLNIGRIVTVERSIAINCNTLQNYEGKWKSYINYKKLEQIETELNYMSLTSVMMIKKYCSCY